MPDHAAQPFIFFAVPYGQETAELRDAVNVASHQMGFGLLRADQRFAGEDVAKEIQLAIQRASLVIGETTSANANVMWELGYAQAMKKPVLLITQDPGSIPFDLASSRIVTYQTGAPFASIVARLSDAIASVVATTPVRESLPRKSARSSVFFSYSHADAEYLNRMLIHLRPVERTGAINLWSDTKIRAGDRWKDEIRKAVDAARVAILLISADFLASEFIVTNELPPLLAAAEAEGARIVPVIVKPSRFVRDESLSRFQALNDPKLPLIRSTEAEREDLYAKLAELVEAEVGT